MKYNKLTQKLLSEGYTADNYPKGVVRIANGGRLSQDPLDNIYGGFEYERAYIEDQTFETACGILCKGKSAMTGTYTHCKDYSFENDAALAICPIKCDKCKHERIEIAGITRCPVKLTDKKYIFEGSIEYFEKEAERIKQEKKESFINAHNNRVCENHMRYTDGEWSFNYDPEVCTRGYCGACTMGGICPVLGRELTKEKGNVYYDIEESGRDYSKDGTLFEGERYHYIIKGKQAFKKPISMDICNLYVKFCSEDLKRKILLNNYHDRLYFAESKGQDLNIDIVNIRAAKKNARDLDQDIRDMQAGIEVIHESDQRANDKRNKKEHRDKLKVQKIKKYRARIRKMGWDAIDEYEKNRILKVLSPEEIDEENTAFQTAEYEKDHKPVQLSLFDL